MKSGKKATKRIKPELFLALCCLLLAVCACKNPIIRGQLQPLMDERDEEERKANTYTVSFNPRGGSAVPNQDVEKGSKASKPEDPARADYDFAGWFKEDACINEWDFNTDTVTRHITLYANWQLKTWIVYFDCMGGSSINPASAPHNTTITKPADSMRPGFGLDGWFKDPALTDEWNFTDDTVTETITLYAKWTRNALDVSLEMESITSVNPTFDPIYISRSAAPPYFLTAIVYVEDESEYDAGSIKWAVQGVGEYADETINGTGASFILDASDERYNTLGGHVLKLEVKQNSITYMVNIPFTILD